MDRIKFLNQLATTPCKFNLGAGVPPLDRFPNFNALENYQHFMQRQKDFPAHQYHKTFESRIFFVNKLMDMGAQIILCDPHRATVIGLNREHQLKGISMTSPDIRAGVSLLIAALSAKGKSIIHNIDQIDRGYQDIEIRLNNIGADIRRIR